ncbi:MAG TPA: 4a-hydroxytetrahydrobiopterin dehydratase [Pirellulaceae bacterium]|nr:4a-hydroxytetrahydrobiopterin dehydratase [Pirellulaceae bacterium]
MADDSAGFDNHRAPNVKHTMDDSPNRDQLVSKRCLPCEGGVAPLSADAANAYLKSLPAWKLTSEGRRIRRDWKFRDFMAAIEFFRRVAEVAEAEQHHPDLHLENYRKVWIEIWTHSVGGLTENDFILAAKIDSLD